MHQCYERAATSGLNVHCHDPIQGKPSTCGLFFLYQSDQLLPFDSPSPFLLIHSLTHTFYPSTSSSSIHSLRHPFTSAHSIKCHHSTPCLSSRLTCSLRAVTVAGGASRQRERTATTAVCILVHLLRDVRVSLHPHTHQLFYFLPSSRKLPLFFRRVNTGVQVCKDCSSFKTRLPQFGYTK